MLHISSKRLSHIRNRLLVKSCFLKYSRYSSLRTDPFAHLWYSNPNTSQQLLIKEGDIKAIQNSSRLMHRSCVFISYLVVVSNLLGSKMANTFFRASLIRFISLSSAVSSLKSCIRTGTPQIGQEYSLLLIYLSIQILQLLV